MGVRDKHGESYSVLLLGDGEDGKQHAQSIKRVKKDHLREAQSLVQ